MRLRKSIDVLKKPLHPLGVSRKKTEKTDKSFEKVIGYVIKKVFLLSEETRLKTR